MGDALTTEASGSDTAVPKRASCAILGWLRGGAGRVLAACAWEQLPNS